MYRYFLNIGILKYFALFYFAGAGAGFLAAAVVGFAGAGFPPAAGFGNPAAVFAGAGFDACGVGLALAGGLTAAGFLTAAGLAAGFASGAFVGGEEESDVVAAASGALFSLLLLLFASISVLVVVVVVAAAGVSDVGLPGVVGLRTGIFDGDVAVAVGLEKMGTAGLAPGFDAGGALGMDVDAGLGCIGALAIEDVETALGLAGAGAGLVAGVGAGFDVVVG